MILNHERKKRKKNGKAIQGERFFPTGAAMRIQKKRNRVNVGNHREEQTSVFCLAQQVSVFYSIDSFLVLPFETLLLFWLLSLTMKQDPKIQFLSAIDVFRSVQKSLWEQPYSKQAAPSCGRWGVKECVQHPVTLSLFLLTMNFMPILVIGLLSRKQKRLLV